MSTAILLQNSCLAIFRLACPVTNRAIATLKAVELSKFYLNLLTKTDLQFQDSQRPIMLEVLNNKIRYLLKRKRWPPIVINIIN